MSENKVPDLLKIADRPRLLALALGAVAACAFPPFGLWPLGLIAVAGFIFLLRRETSAKKASILGWLFGWSHLTVANNWIATAFGYQTEMPAFLGWLAVP